MGNTDEVKDLLASGGDVNQRNSVSEYLSIIVCVITKQLQLL